MSAISTASPSDVSVIPTPNATAINFTRVTVALAATPQQLPALAIPNGRALTVRAAASNGNKLIYVATSSADALDATKRLVLAKGDTVSLFVSNANVLWIGASVDGVDIELVVEV